MLVVFTFRVLNNVHRENIVSLVKKRIGPPDLEAKSLAHLVNSIHLDSAFLLIVIASISFFKNDNRNS